MDDYFKTEFNCSNKTYFGYLESKGIVMYIFIQDENEKNIEEINRIIADQIATNFLLNSTYTIENIKNIIYKVNKFLEKEKEKNLDLKFSNYSLLLLLTNKITFFVASIGNIKLTLLRNKIAAYISKLDNVAQDLYINKEIEFDDIINNKYRNTLTNSIGGLNALKINFSGELNLNIEDQIIIQGIKSWEKGNLALNEDTVKIKVIKIDEKNIKKEKKGYVKLSIMFVIISLIIFYFFNSYRVNKYNNAIEKIKSNLEVYKKNNAVKSVEKEIVNLEKIYKNMYKEKILYIPRNIEINKIKDNIYIKDLKEELKENREIIKEIIKAENYIEINEYKKAFEIYKNLNIKNSEYNKDKIMYGLNKATELMGANEKELVADNYFENKEYKKAFDIYNEIYKIYYKYKIENYIKNILFKKIENSRNEIKNLENLLLKSIEEAINIKKNDLIKSKNKFKDAYELSLKIDNGDILKKIEENQKEIEKEIEYELINAKTLREEGLNYLKNKNYKASLESLLESNIRFRKLKLLDEENENNKTIRKLKIMIRKNKKPVLIRENLNNKKTEKKNLEIKIMKSIYLSIEKGDELIRKNEFKKALEEYERAFEFSKKVKIPEGNIKKLLEKIKYSRKKINSYWWK